MSEQALGVGHRLRQAPSDLLAQTAFAHELEAAEWLWHGMAMADLAHALAIDAAGLLPDHARAPLFGALLAATELDPDAEPLDPRVGDIYNNRDRMLRDMAGPAAGFVHTGRARREASTIGWQLECRRLLIELGRSTAALVATIADVADRHVDVVMPDFTYLHRAHPTTLAHYLIAHAAPLQRHLGRVSHTLELVDSSPAGSGSTNGSRLPIDRRLLAELLGFGSIVRHTRDAMWATDMALDIAHVSVQIMTSIDRVAEELQLWTTEAFAFVELPDELSRTSVVMPHKKNPYALTYLRGLARHVLGTSTGVAATQLTASGQPDNRTIAYLDGPAMLDRTRAAVDLLTAVLAGADFDSNAMRAAASSGFTTSTEICDELALRGGLDNRTAHSIVGAAVHEAVTAGRSDLDWADLQHAAHDAGVDLALDRERFAQLLDPDEAIASRVTPGGVGRSEVDAMIGELRDASEHSIVDFDEHPSHGYDDRLVARATEAFEAATRKDIPSS